MSIVKLPTVVYTPAVPGALSRPYSRSCPPPSSIVSPPGTGSGTPPTGSKTIVSTTVTPIPGLGPNYPPSNYEICYIYADGTSQCHYQ